jgi:phytoene synthase
LIPAADSLGGAYAACLALARSHYENFPTASWLLPRELRAPVAAVYAFARTADDFADEALPGGSPERLRLLADWRGRLHRAAAGTHENHPVFWALHDVISRFDLPLDPFDRLITAFERDVTVRRFPTFERLLDYCHHSADPVGELVLRLFRVWTPERGRRSDAICTALQLANFWQDVTVDAAKDRIYAPLEDLKTMEVSERDYQEGPFTESHRELMAHQVDRTWTLFREGRPLCNEGPWRLRLWLRAVWLGGTSILEKVEARRWDVWSGRPAPSKGDWLRMAPRWLFWRP